MKKFLAVTLLASCAVALNASDAELKKNVAQQANGQSQAIATPNIDALLALGHTKLSQVKAMPFGEAMGKSPNDANAAFSQIFDKDDMLEQSALLQKAVQNLAQNGKAQPFLQDLDATLGVLAQCKPMVDRMGQAFPDFFAACQKDESCKMLVKNLAPRVKLIMAMQKTFQNQSLSSFIGFAAKEPQILKEMGIEIPKELLEKDEQAKELAAMRQSQQAMQAQMTELMAMLKAQQKPADKQA